MQLSPLLPSPIFHTHQLCVKKQTKKSDFQDKTRSAPLNTRHAHTKSSSRQPKHRSSCTKPTCCTCQLQCRGRLSSGPGYGKSTFLPVKLQWTDVRRQESKTRPRVTAQLDHKMLQCNCCDHPSLYYNLSSNIAVSYEAGNGAEAGPKSGFWTQIQAKRIAAGSLSWSSVSRRTAIGLNASNKK